MCKKKNLRFTLYSHSHSHARCLSPSYSVNFSRQRSPLPASFHRSIFSFLFIAQFYSSSFLISFLLFFYFFNQIFNVLYLFTCLNLFTLVFTTFIDLRTFFLYYFSRFLHKTESDGHRGALMSGYNGP